MRGCCGAELCPWRMCGVLQAILRSLQLRVMQQHRAGLPLTRQGSPWWSGTAQGPQGLLTPCSCCCSSWLDAAVDQGWRDSLCPPAALVLSVF